MIEAHALTKRFGTQTAVDGIDFRVEPGRVTGFLGPNGAGKSTTMRMIAGLDRATSGDVTVNGRHYREHRAPLREVGILLDAKAVHTGRTAYKHLLAMAATHGNRAGTLYARSSSSRALTRSPTSGSAGSRSAWANAWASPPHCSATPQR